MRIWDTEPGLAWQSQHSHSAVGWSGKLWGLQPNSPRGPRESPDTRARPCPLQNLCHRAGLTAGSAAPTISAAQAGTGSAVTFPRSGAEGKGPSKPVSPCSLTEALLPSGERSAISWLVNVMNSCTLRGHSTGPGGSAGRTSCPTALRCTGVTNSSPPDPISGQWGCSSVVGFPWGRGLTLDL